MIVESEDDIQRAINKMNETFRSSKVKINNTKTKILICTIDSLIKTDVYIDSQKTKSSIWNGMLRD